MNRQSSTERKDQGNRGTANAPNTTAQQNRSKAGGSCGSGSALSHAQQGRQAPQTSKPSGGWGCG